MHIKIFKIFHRLVYLLVVQFKIYLYIYIYFNYRFPNNKEQTHEWMQAIGVSNVSKHIKVCSDHFHSNSFHDTDGYTTKRRLLSSAIPFKTNTAALSNITNKPVVRTNETESETLQLNPNVCISLSIKGTFQILFKYSLIT